MGPGTQAWTNHLPPPCTVEPEIIHQVPLYYNPVLSPSLTSTACFRMHACLNTWICPAYVCAWACSWGAQGNLLCPLDQVPDLLIVTIARWLQPLLCFSASHCILSVSHIEPRVGNLSFRIQLDSFFSFNIYLFGCTNRSWKL